MRRPTPASLLEDFDTSTEQAFHRNAFLQRCSGELGRQLQEELAHGQQLQGRVCQYLDIRRGIHHALARLSGASSNRITKTIKDMTRRLAEASVILGDLAVETTEFVDAHGERRRQFSHELRALGLADPKYRLENKLHRVPTIQEAEALLDKSQRVIALICWALDEDKLNDMYTESREKEMLSAWSDEPREEGDLIKSLEVGMKESLRLFMQH